MIIELSKNNEMLAKPVDNAVIKELSINFFLGKYLELMNINIYN